MPLCCARGLGTINRKSLLFLGKIGVEVKIDGVFTLSSESWYVPLRCEDQRKHQKFENRALIQRDN